MKKIITALFFMVSVLGFNAVNAQQKVTKKSTAKTTMTKSKDSTMAKKPGMKKDGTADMRYKENKVKTKTVAPAGPTKKDGTADMRYKANKEKVKTKSK